LIYNVIQSPVDRLTAGQG